jgi:hypothetical protein
METPMPAIILKTSTDVVIRCIDHQDFIMGLFIWDEFQGWCSRCGGPPLPPTAQELADLQVYLQLLPTDTDIETQQPPLPGRDPSCESNRRRTATPLMDILTRQDRMPEEMEEMDTLLFH